jgi:hypothetical protein
MENNFERELNYQQAKAELVARLKTMGTIAVFWFVLFRLLTLWTDGVGNLDLIRDAITAAAALYLPYRVVYQVIGTPTCGAVGTVIILLWMSTWIGDHELLGWIVIVGGYAIDFGPCICRLIANRKC